MVLNKIDLIDRKELLPLIDSYAALYPFKAIVPVSAMNGDGCRPLIYRLQEALDTLAPPPPLKETSPDELFPDDDEATDNSDNESSR